MSLSARIFKCELNHDQKLTVYNCSVVINNLLERYGAIEEIHQTCEDIEVERIPSKLRLCVNLSELGEYETTSFILQSVILDLNFLIHSLKTDKVCYSSVCIMQTMTILERLTAVLKSCNYNDLMK